MRHLSLLCFSDEVFRFGDVDGTWGDLDADRQGKVLIACRAGLLQGPPTPFSEGNGFTTANFAEAMAFDKALQDESANDWLDARMIGTWLPVVLRTRGSRAVETVAACAAKDRAATVVSLVVEIERELNSGESQLFFAHVIPAELWPGILGRRIAEFADDPRLPAPTRAALLKTLAWRDAGEALPVAVRWSRRQGEGDDDELLRRAALDVLLALDAESAWSLIEVDHRRRGAEALRDWSSLRRGSGLSVNLADWPTDRLEGLGRVLLEAFPLPPEDEPPHHTGWLGLEDELCNVRDRVIDLLIRRHVEGDEAAAATLCALAPRLQRRLDWEIQQHQAAQLLAGITLSATPAGEGPGIPIQVVARVLDDGDFRLVRSVDDLLAAILHALAQVGGDVAFDLSMLYGKNEPAESPQEQPASAPSSGPKKKTKLHKRLGEDALQAYVRRRLCDMLPGRIPGIAFELIREAQGMYQRRFDLDILAPCLDGRLARVTVEIKWSDNAETGTSLVEQLGRKYLLGHCVTHGIYLVGWNGSCRFNKKKVDGIEALRTHLSGQAKAFSQTDEGRMLKIEPVVVDLRWRDDLA